MSVLCNRKRVLINTCRAPHEAMAGIPNDEPELLLSRKVDSSHDICGRLSQDGILGQEAFETGIWTTRRGPDSCRGVGLARIVAPQRDHGDDRLVGPGSDVSRERRRTVRAGGTETYVQVALNHCIATSAHLAGFAVGIPLKLG
jgi:hypothetical protein